MTEPKVSESPSLPQIVWVNKWIDYSNKYGIGYELSNGIIGLYFKDNTKMIGSQQQTLVKYISKGDGKDEDVVIYDCEFHPKEMRKKITLFKHFKKFFAKSEEKNITQLLLDNDDFLIREIVEPEDPKMLNAPVMQNSWLEELEGYTQYSEFSTVYVRKVLKSRHAIMFKLAQIKKGS